MIVKYLFRVFNDFSNIELNKSLQMSYTDGGKYPIPKIAP